MDVIYQGMTWRREVAIVDQQDPPQPVEPTEVAAVLAVPASATWDGQARTVDLTVTPTEDPDDGLWFVELDAEGTADLPAPATVTLEVAGLIGSDTLQLVRLDVAVHPFTVRLEV